MAAADVNINDYYWSLKTKFKLEIGISNLLSNEYSPTFGKYPEIVWFPMGTYILTSFNTSLSVNGLTISLSGKDKMCMLNGELGGQLFASIDFGTEETLSYQVRKVEPTADNSNTLMSYDYYEKVDSNDTSIEQCVFELDNNSGNWFLLNGSYIYDNTNPKTYAGNHYTKYKKIITPHQLFVSADTTQTCIANTYFYKKQDQPDYYLLNTTASWKSEDNNFQLKDLYEVERNYSIKKIPLEKIIRESVHAYAKEPFHNIIIQDVDKYALEQVLWRGDEPLVVLRQKSTGHFTNVRFLKDFSVANEEGFQWDSLVEESIATTGSIIQNNSGTFIISSEEDYQSASDSEKKQFYTAAKIEYGQDIGYRITDLVYNGDLITSIGESLTSVLDKIKNMLGDFEYFYDTDGRFIFRRKPIYVNTSWSHFITTDDERYVTYANNLSKYSYSFEGNSLITAIQNTPVLTNLKNDFIVWGKRKGINGEDIPIHARYAIDKKPTYYKALNGQVYTTTYQHASDNVVDWREIIYQMALDYFAGHGCSEEQPLYISDENNPGNFIPMIYPDDFLAEVAARNPSLYPTGYTGYEQYYTDMQGFWRQLYYPNFPHEYKYTPGEYTENIIRNKTTGFYTKAKEWVDQTKEDISQYFGEEEINFKWWNKNIRYNPEALNFWIDFLDQGEELAQFSIPQVGDRQKVINDDKVSAIIFKEIPDLILYDTRPSEDISQTPTKEMLDSQTGYTWIYIPKGFNQYLSISYRNISAKNKIDDLIYQYAYCAENISLTAIPVYYLEPNSLIQVFDEKSNINGEYIVSKISFSLNHNGTMQISASKSPKSQTMNASRYYTVSYINGRTGLQIGSELVALGSMPTQLDYYNYWTSQLSAPESQDDCIDFGSFEGVFNDLIIYGWDSLFYVIQYYNGANNSYISSELVSYGDELRNIPNGYYWTDSTVPPESISDCVDLEEYTGNNETRIFYGWLDFISYRDTPTLIRIKLDNDSGLTQDFYFEQTGSYKVKIDWGDGSISREFSNAMVNCTHTYSAYGFYNIYIYVENNNNVYWKPGHCVSIDNDQFTSFTGITSIGSLERNQTIQSITFGPGLRLTNKRSFMYCSALNTLDFTNIDNGIDIASETFYYSFDNLFDTLTIPAKINKIGTRAFYNCNFFYLNCAAKILDAWAFSACSLISKIWLRNSCKQISATPNTSPWTNCSSSCILYCESNEKIATWGEDYNVYSFSHNNTQKDRFITVWTQITSPFEANSVTLNSRLNYSWLFNVSDNDYNSGQGILPLTINLFNGTEDYRNRGIDWAQGTSTMIIADYSDETDNPGEEGSYFTVSYYNGETGALISEETVEEGTSPSFPSGFNYWTDNDTRPHDSSDCINEEGLEIDGDISFYGWFDYEEENEPSKEGE